MPALLGLWETADKEAVIAFEKCEKALFCGRFYWLESDAKGEISRDDKNPDPLLRKRPLCGLVFMGGFEDKGQGRFEGGWLYSPRHGSTFSANIQLKGDTLDLRGYVFLPFLGGGQTWRRVAASPRCAGYDSGPVSK